MDHQFRNAVFGGFNRQDVLDYLETLAGKMPRSARSWSRASAGPKGAGRALRPEAGAGGAEAGPGGGRRKSCCVACSAVKSELAALRTQLGEQEQTARQTQQALEESRREAEALQGAGGPAGAGRGCLRRGEGPLRRGVGWRPTAGPRGCWTRPTARPGICASRWSSG